MSHKMEKTKYIHMKITMSEQSHTGHMPCYTQAVGCPPLCHENPKTLPKTLKP